MISKITSILLVFILVGCKGGAGSPALNLPSNPTPADTNEESTPLYSLDEYILPSMEIHSVYHGGYDVHVSDDESIIVAGLIKVFDPNLGTYPQKTILWNISAEQISFNELQSGSNIFKTNFNDIAGVDHNYVKISFNNIGNPIIGYINYSGKFSIVSSEGNVATTNIDCDHISSALDEDLMEHRFSCLKNVTTSNTDLKHNIIGSGGNLILTKTYSDKASMNSAHTFDSKNGESFIFVKNYANLNQQKNFSLLTSNGIQVLAYGQSDWGNLELSNIDESKNLCITNTGSTLKKYDVTQMGTSPIVGINVMVNQTLANCLPLSTTETLFYSESSSSSDKGYILDGNGEKILNLNAYGFKKVFLSKKINDDLFIIGIEAKSNQTKLLKINKL